MTTSTTAKPEAAGKRSLARAKPVSDGERARIRELHDTGLNCRQIAREMNRTPATISKHAAALGLKFDRSQTREATAAREADLAAIRVLVSGEFLMIAQRINRKVLALLDNPDADLKPWGLRDLAYASGAYFDRHLAQDVHDKGDGDADNAVDMWLAAMLGSTPPPSRGGADDTTKAKVMLAGLADRLFAVVDEDAAPGGVR